MIYTDVSFFNSNQYLDVKINENAKGKTVIKQLSRIVSADFEKLFILNKRTGRFIDGDKLLKEQDVKGGDTFIIVLTNNEIRN